MDPLEKRVTGDWFEIREAAGGYESLREHFRLSPDELEPHVEKLKYSVEQGIVEYKRATLGPLFRMLESTKYQSPGLPVIENQIAHARALLYITLIQRLFTEGRLKPSRRRRVEERIDPDDLGFKDILQDVNRRIRESPEAEKHKPVKMILLQVGMFRKEQETFKKLLPTIKQENKRAFVLNFKKRFGEIIDKIKRNYIDLLEKENPPTEDVRNPLEIVALAAVAPILTAQCQVLARILSTLGFVREEKYKTREILMRLAEVRDSMTGLFEREMRHYGRLAEALDPARIEEYGSADVSGLLSRLLRQEIVMFLEREISYDKTLRSR